MYKFNAVNKPSVNIQQVLNGKTLCCVNNS